MNESFLDTLEDIISRQVRDKAIPSISYVLTDRDQVLAAGHATNPGQSHQIDGRTLFRIGSLTKMFTAIGIMQLAEQGFVDIDAAVSRYIPGFQSAKSVSGRRRTAIRP